MSMDTLPPTRMNLLKRKEQVKFAQEGAGLLKGKRDALLQELLKRARELHAMRDELFRRGRDAAVSLALAQAVRGTPELRSAATAGRRDLNITVNTVTVWGLSLAEVEIENVVRNTAERGAGLLDCSAHVHEASESFEEMLEQLLKCAPLERNLQIIGEEVKKVNRRINALEEYLIPTYREDMRAIAQVLDEREREDIFRLKRIKGKKAAERKEKKLDQAAAETGLDEGGSDMKTQE
ncbi:MAG: V-type ATP synthase subunit D [Candidatus Hydrogenedentota bacterium]